MVQELLRANQCNLSQYRCPSAIGRVANLGLVIFFCGCFSGDLGPEGHAPVANGTVLDERSASDSGHPLTRHLAMVRPGTQHDLQFSWKNATRWKRVNPVITNA